MRGVHKLEKANVKGLIFAFLTNEMLTDHLEHEEKNNFKKGWITFFKMKGKKRQKEMFLFIYKEYCWKANHSPHPQSLTPNQCSQGQRRLTSLSCVAGRLG